MAQDKLELVTKHLSDLLDVGWTVAALSRESGVNQITLGNIKNRKATRVTDKVYQRIADCKARIDAGNVPLPGRGRKTTGKSAAGKHDAPASPSVSATADRPAPKAPAKKSSPAKHHDGMINNDYVPVNVAQLQGVIDRLIENFAGAIAELESIKKQIRQ